MTMSLNVIESLVLLSSPCPLLQHGTTSLHLEIDVGGHVGRRQASDHSKRSNARHGWGLPAFITTIIFIVLLGAALLEDARIYEVIVANVCRNRNAPLLLCA